MKRMKKIIIKIYILISGGLITGMKNLFHFRWAYNRGGETITGILWYLIFSMIPIDSVKRVPTQLNKGVIKLNKAIL